MAETKKRVRLTDAQWVAEVRDLDDPARVRAQRALETSLRRVPLRTAQIRARLATLELGSTAPGTIAAWDRVRELQRALDVVQP